MEFKETNQISVLKPMESSLHSPKDGVPILNMETKETSIIQTLEKSLGLQSWMENI